MIDMEGNQFISEILSQPGSLMKALNQFDASSLASLSRSITSGDIDRIILTGMGASFFSVIPASILLGKCGLPILRIDTAELIHYGRDLISPRSLIWAVSQSGQSAEVISLLGIIKSAQPRVVLATVNNQNSPLAKAASLVIPLVTEPEQSASTRTYLNSLALMQLAALVLTEEDITPGFNKLVNFVDSIQGYLDNWEKNLEQIADIIAVPKYLALLGRGPSLASVFAGALVLQEAARFPAMGFQAAQFRHGPLEMTCQDVTVLCFAGPSGTFHLNKNLISDLDQMGVKAVWLDSRENERTFSEEKEVNGMKSRLPLPIGNGICLPLAEIVPIQLLSIHLANVFGFEPGEFIRAKKVTLSE